MAAEFYVDTSWTGTLDDMVEEGDFLILRFTLAQEQHPSNVRPGPVAVAIDPRSFLQAGGDAHHTAVEVRWISNDVQANGVAYERALESHTP